MGIQLIRRTTPEVKPPAPAVPRIVPGYLDDLLRRLEDRTMLPLPPGAEASSAWWVSTIAGRESRLINDGAILPQIRAKLDAGTTPKELEDIAQILGHLIANTGDATANHLLAGILKKAPKKQLTCFLFAARDAATPEAREFALPLIKPHRWTPTSDALLILAAVGDDRDFDFLANMLFDEKTHESNYSSILVALTFVGREKAFPNLQRFIEKHKTSKKKFRQWEVKNAQLALIDLPKFLEQNSSTHGIRVPRK